MDIFVRYDSKETIPNLSNGLCRTGISFNPPINNAIIEGTINQPKKVPLNAKVPNTKRITPPQ